VVFVGTDVFSAAYYNITIAVCLYANKLIEKPVIDVLIVIRMFTDRVVLINQMYACLLCWNTCSACNRVSLCCFWFTVTSSTITRTQCELAIDECNQEQCEEVSVVPVLLY